MGDIHVTDKGVAYVSSHHTDDEIRAIIPKAEHVYVDYHQLGEQAAIEESKRINAAYVRAGHHGAVVIGIQGEPLSFNGEGTRLSSTGFTPVTEHFDVFAARVGQDSSDHTLRVLLRQKRAAQLQL